MITIIEGLDNVGKGTQIRNILGILAPTKPTHIIHYSAIPGMNGEDAYEYSVGLYHNMFRLLSRNYEKSHFILDRSHLGESVYAPKYRGYNGDYVFDIESQYTIEEFWKEIKLITFVDKAENLIARDDGLSHSININDKNDEIKAFKRAHEMSLIEDKILIDIDGLNIEQVFEKIKEFLGE